MNRTFLAIGFRPFYFGAGLFAALAIPVWVTAYLTGRLSPGGFESALLWHSHEMVFGFAPAVIAGFLLTAVRNWTGRPTPEGPALGALFGLWAAARILNTLDTGMVGLLVDVSFLPVLAAVLAVPLWRSRNWRNAFVVVLLVLLGGASLAHHLAIRGLLAQLPPGLATTLALDLVLILMTVIGGRVIPAFSSNAIPGLKPLRSPLIDGAAIGLAVLILLADAARWTGPWIAALFWIAATAQVIRLAGWQPWKTWRNPLLLALPLAYAWIPVHLLLRIENPAIAMHALTVGAMAGLMLAMMTRSALGHTGRPLAARPPELVCFAAIHAAAACRVFGPAFSGVYYQEWMIAAAGCWTLAFGTFAIAYWPILTSPRADLS